MRSTFLITLIACIFAANGQNCPFSYNYQEDFDLCLSRERYSESWNMAAWDCSNDGGNLLSIHNAFQNGLLGAMIHNGTWNNERRYTWLGAVQDVNGAWTWLDGTAFDYQRFDSLTPTNACVVLDTSTHWWRNTACDDPGSGGGAYFCGHAVTIKLTTQYPETTKSPQNLNCLPVDQQPLYNCQKDWVYSVETGFSYKILFDRRFLEGEAECVSEGGHLASIHSDAENDFVTNLCCPTRCKYFAHDGGHSLYLVGGYRDLNETWWWTDGTTFDYQRGGCDFHSSSGAEQLLYIRNGVGSIDECSTYCPQMGLWLMRYRQSDPSTPYLVCKRRL